MKSFGIILVGAAVAVAQIPANTPACGVTCINNMVAKAPSLGCTAGDLVCYCNTPDFGFGIRDCSNESCPNASDAQAALSAGITYCSDILARAGQTTSSGAQQSTGTGSGVLSSAPTTSAITTSALTSVGTSDGSAFTTTTGSTTIYGYNGTPIVGGAAGTGAVSGATSAPTTTAITTSALTSVGTSNGSAFTTTTGSTTISGYNGTPIVGAGGVTSSGASTSGASTSGATTGTTVMSSPVSSARPTTTTSTTPNAAMKTAAPAFLGLAAFAVLAL